MLILILGLRRHNTITKQWASYLLLDTNLESVEMAFGLESASNLTWPVDLDLFTTPGALQQDSCALPFPGIMLL